MKLLLILVSTIGFVFSASAETTKEMEEAGSKKPTWDQPLPDQTNQQVVKSSSTQTSAPPVKGVIHLRRDANPQIDPEREYPLLGKKGTIVKIDPEREYPLLGKKGTIVNIDPERENPLLGKKGTKLEVTIPGIGPGKVIGVDVSGGLLGRSPIGSTKPKMTTTPAGPVVPVPPVTNMNGEKWAETFPLPGQVDVLKMVVFLQGKANFLNQFDAKPLYTQSFSIAAVMGSLAVIGYQVMALGGRQKVVAAVIPPDVLLKVVGRDGYRVPANPNYTLDDVAAVSEALGSLEGDELVEYYQALPEDLVLYFIEVSTLVEQADRYEKALEYQKMCPNPDRCS